MKEVKYDELLTEKFIPKETLLIRVKNLLIWYSKKAQKNKWLYLAMSITVVIITAAIPVINSLEDVKMIVSVMSALASVLTSISVLLNLKDNWQRYRKSSEMVKREISLYAHRAGEDYDGLTEEAATKKFAVKLEEIASNENRGWEKHFGKNVTDSQQLADKNGAKADVKVK